MATTIDLLPEDYATLPPDAEAVPVHDGPLPAIAPLVEALLGAPYAQVDCWQLTRTLLTQGWDLQLPVQQERAIHHVQEIWWQGEGTDPRPLVQPWDIVIFRTRGDTTQHLGLMVDPQRFVHTGRRTGVCLEPLQRWHRRLVQVARLRRLPAPARPPAGAPVQPGTGAGVHTVVVVSPLRGPLGVLRTVRTAQPAGQVLTAYLPPREHWHHVAVNGGVIPAEHWVHYVPRDGDEIWCYPQWGEIGTLLAYAGISLAVGLLTSVASHYLFRPKPLLLQPQTTMTQPEDRTYSFEGIRTAVGPGAIIPVIYGTHRVGGQLLAASVDPAHFVYNQGAPGPNAARTITLVWGGDALGPIYVQALGHGFQTTDVVAIQGVQGKVATNSTWQITVLDGNVFALNGSENRDASPYTGGGVVWRVSGGNNNIQRAVALSPTLSLLLALGEGEIDAVLTDTILINEQPITNFPGVELFTRTGTPDQTPIAELGETRNTYADGRPIPSDVSLQYTMQAPATGFVLNIGFLEGLLNVSETGEKGDNVAWLQYRWSVSGTGAWTNWVTVPVAADRAAPVRIGLRQDHLPLALYQLEIWAHGGGADGSVVAWFTDELRAKWRSTLESVTEIIGGTTAYPNTALLGIRALATEQLQGGLPNVTVVVRGRKVRQGSFAAAPTWTDNPAWCVMDLCTNQRYGQGWPDAEIDLTGFGVFAAECDLLIDGEKRHVLNLVLDREERTQPMLLTALGPARALLLKSGVVWTPRPTRDETPTMLLSWASVSNVTLTYSRDVDNVNVMEARFANEETDYSQDVLTWPSVALWPTPKQGHSIDLRGLTKPSRVIRALQYELNRRRYENVVLELDAMADAMPMQIHDLFRFAHPLPGWGTSGRVQAGSDLVTVVLDQAVTLVGGVTYLLYVRHEDGTVEARQVLPVVLGAVTTVTLVSALSQVPTALTSVYDFGTLAADGNMRTFRVTDLQRKSDTTVHLEAIIHNPSIYDDPVGQALPPVTQLPNPLGPPPPLTALVLTEVTRIQSSGTSLRVVNLSWDVAPLSAGYAPYGGVTILRRTVTASGAAGQVEAGAQSFGLLQDPQDSNLNFTILTQLRGHVLDFDDYTVVTGATYVYRVVPISGRGVPNNLGALEGTIHVAGPTTPGYFPGTPQNLRLKGQAVGVTTYEGYDISFEWDPVPPSPLFSATFFVLDYVVQIWAPGQTYLMLNTAVPLGPPNGSVTWTYSYAQNTEDNVRAGQRGPRRDVAIFVWARTNTGRLSLDPATLTVTNPPPDMSSIEPDTIALFEAGIVEWTQWVEPRDLDHYAVLLDTVTPPPTFFYQLPRGSQKILLPGLQAAVPYYVQIVPWDTFGPGIPSAIATFTPVAIDADKLDSTPPAVPTGLSLQTAVVVQPDGTSQPWIEAHWNPNTEDDLAGYELAFRLPPSTLPTLRTAGPLDTSLRFDAVPGDVTIAATILAFDKFYNRSAFSEEVTITTGADTSPPASPENLTAVGSIRSVALLWTPPGDADYAHTEVWAALSNQRQLASMIGSGLHSFVHEGLGANETQYFWIRAVDRSGNVSSFHPLAETDGVSGTAGQLDTTYISSLAADKILTGTLQALVSIGVAGRVFLDGVNNQILIYDDQTPTPQLRVWLGKLGALSTDYGLIIFNAAGQVMFNILDGGVHADGIAAGSIRAGHLRTDTAVITVAAQIANAIIGDAHITSLSATKISAGTINVTLPLGGNSLYLDGTTQAIWVFDQQFPQRARLVLGKLGSGTQDYGLVIWDAAGMPLLTAAGITANGIPTGTIQANHLRVDQAVITQTAQIQDAIISDAKIGSITADKITGGTITATTGLGIGAGAMYLDAPNRRFVVHDANNMVRTLLGRLGSGIEDYGLQVNNASGVVMWRLDGGATTQGIYPNAVSASLYSFTLGPFVYTPGGEGAIITFGVPAMEANERAWVSIHAQVQTSATTTIRLRQDSVAGAVLSWSTHDATVIEPTTVHAVYVAPGAVGIQPFVMTVDTLGSVTLSSINFVILHLKR
jgi:hypothetical protein